MIFPISPTVRTSAALLLALALGACGKSEPPPEPVRAVKVVTVGETGTLSDMEFSGEVRARVESGLGFRVGGKLIARPAELGQRVKAGQLLAQIDPQDYSLAADAARAQLLAAQTNRDLAAADLKRYQDLRDQGFISAAELERRDASYKAAQAQWQQAQAQSTVQGNQSGYTRLLADGPGVVTAVDANVGQVLAAGQPVLRLALDGPRDVVFAVPEDKLLAFKTGTRVMVRLWTSGHSLSAQVRDVAASADPVTRTFLVKAALLAPGKGQPPVPEADVVLGATATVALPASHTPAQARIKLPTSALRMEAGATSVWVLNPASMTVTAQALEVDAADGNEVIVRSGLKPGDQVVTSGVHVLTAGQQVSLFQATAKK